MGEYKEGRATCVGVFIGINNTGKTTLAKKIVTSFKNRRVLVVQYAGLEDSWNDYPVIDLKSPELETFTGIRQAYFMRHDKQSWTLLFERFHNGVLVLDDCKNYIDPRVEGPLLRLLVNRRQLMIDIYVMVHAFKQLPPKFYDYCEEYFIFKSISSPVVCKDNLEDNYPIIHAAWQRVNRKAGNDKTKPEFHTFEYLKL
jgi:hypothetical protein